MQGTPPPPRYSPQPSGPAAQVRPAEPGTGPQHHREDLYTYVAERVHDETEIGHKLLEQRQEQQELLRKLDNAAERARAEQARKPGLDRKAPTRQRKR